MTEDAQRCYNDTDAELRALHKILYRRTTHPGNVFYLLLCRVVMGHTMNTIGGATSMDDGSEIWTVQDKVLAAVPEVSPPIHYHSLVAEPSPYGRIQRHREFIQFEKDRVYVDYVLAYQRRV